MKVTAEMIDDVAEATGVAAVIVHAVLEAALADVPDHPEGIALECFREEHRARERAEAKLAKVRAWADGHGVLCCVDKLKAILDEP